MSRPGRDDETGGEEPDTGARIQADVGDEPAEQWRTTGREIAEPGGDSDGIGGDVGGYSGEQGGGSGGDSDGIGGDGDDLADERGSMGRWPAGVVPLAWTLLVLLVGSVLVVAVVAFIDDDPLGDPGRLTEPIYQWQLDDGPLPTLVDVTASWGLDTIVTTGDHPVRGGAAIADFDGDGRDDLAIAGGELTVALATEAEFIVMDLTEVVGGDAIAVNAADVDGDGLVDLLVSTTADDVIIWGGTWGREIGVAGALRTSLASDDATSALIVADLNGDGLRDVAQLGNGQNGATPDLIHYQSASRRSFDTVTELPNSRRFSMAAELIDADNDGLLDLWVTRDLGWRDGANSVYSRRGVANGPWTDIAPDINADQAIDGMGVTVADLNGDGDLDVYLSDLGDNQTVVRGAVDPGGSDLEPLWFEAPAAGLGRIRPVGAGDDIVSSTWAAGVTDLNLDGRLDVVMVQGGFRERLLINKIQGTTVQVEDPPAIFLGRDDGTYADIWAELGLSWTDTSRGLALGDLDGDGDSDIVIVNYGAPIIVLRNDSVGASTTVSLDPSCRLDGAVAGISGLGASIVARLGGNTFLGQHGPSLVAGGSALEVSVTDASGTAVALETRTAANRTFVTATCPLS